MSAELSAWPEVNFGDIFEISSSKRVLQSQWRKQGVPFYRAREIVKLAQDGHVDNDLFISEDLFTKLSQRYGAPLPGDLMVSAVGTLGACYEVQAEDRFYFKDASVLRFSPKVELCPRFFWHSLHTQALRQQILATSGSTVGTLTISRANQLKVGFPPLDEQRRIAAILDKADQLRQKRRQAIALLDSLTQSIFLEMFKNFGEAPLFSIGEFCTVKGGKRLPKGHDYIDDDEGHYYLRVSDFQKSNLSKNSLKRISRATHQEIRRYVVSFEDLAISIAGTIGETVLISKALDGVNLTENAAKISILDRQKVDPAYLKVAISMPHAQKQIASSTGQVTIGKLALFRIEKIEIPLPRIEKQVAFAGVVRAIECQRSNLEMSANKTEALFSSLQHRAFSGQL